jgi:hypothetical protein
VLGSSKVQILGSGLKLTKGIQMKKREFPELKIKKTKEIKRTFVSLIGPERTYLKKNKLLGGYVPNRVYEFFALLALMQNKSLSELLKYIINEYIKDYDEEEVLKQLCDEILDSWIETIEDNDGNKFWTEKRLRERWKKYKEDLNKVHLKTLPEYYKKIVFKYVEEAKF